MNCGNGQGIGAAEPPKGVSAICSNPRDCPDAKFYYDYPLDNTMWEWSYVPCKGDRYYPGDPHYVGPSINDMVFIKEKQHCNEQTLPGEMFDSKVTAILACDRINKQHGGVCQGVFDADCDGSGKWKLCNNQA